MDAIGRCNQLENMKQCVTLWVDRGRGRLVCVSRSLSVHNSYTLVWNWPCLVLPVVFKDFWAEGPLRLFRWFMGVHLSSQRSIDINNTPCALLWLSLVTFFWSQALYANAHMDLHDDSPCSVIKPLHHFLSQALISLHHICGCSVLSALCNMSQCECKHNCKCISLQVSQLN